jgi:low affinity Fe/Cu permease
MNSDTISFRITDLLSCQNDERAMPGSTFREPNLRRPQTGRHGSVEAPMFAAYNAHPAGRGRAGGIMNRLLERLAGRVTAWTGGNGGFATAVGVIVVWAVLGPVFRYSDTWQLVINTGTTIVTFLMVFLIQRSQNKDALAIHIKLNELVAAVEGASNRLIDVEGLSEEDLEVLREHFHELAKLAKGERDTRQSHSIDEARQRHEFKRRSRPEPPKGDR